MVLPKIAQRFATRKQNLMVYHYSWKRIVAGTHATRSILSCYYGQRVPQVRHFSAASTTSIRTPTITNEDYFGESVTLFPDNDDENNESDFMMAYNNFLLAVLTKGKACTGGLMDQGIHIKAAHACSHVWSDFLETRTDAPMKTVLIVAPILVQANVSHLKRIDANLPESTLSLSQRLQHVQEYYDNDNSDNNDRCLLLSQRERGHLKAMQQLANGQRTEAVQTYLKLLIACPGDALALCLCIELCSVMGDSRSALLAATSVFSYWQERKGFLSSYSIGAAWMSVGLVAGGRYPEAERLLEISTSAMDLEASGGVAAWATAMIMDAEGRTAEGISFLAGYDGVKKYESCGYLFFDSKLSGYGGHFSLDREGNGEGLKSLRIYEYSFERVLVYSGYGDGKRLPPWPSPRGASGRAVEAAGSFFSNIFGSTSNAAETQSKDGDATVNESETPSLEAIFTWLPPTPQLLTDATSLLLRLTLHGVVDGRSHYWSHLRNAWQTLLMDNEDSLPVHAVVASSLNLGVTHDSLLGGESQSSPIVQGAVLLGKVLGISDSTYVPTEQDWKDVVLLLSQRGLSTYPAWEIDSSTLVEVVVCHAACQTDDLECLSIARSICSRGVALRVNCPEEYARYSQVLEKLGDEHAADHARMTSISLGAGEGGAGSH